METLKAILSRRSIRKYFDRPVNDEMIRLLLKAGMYAPSARNKQPWHFIVVRDRKILDKLAVAHPLWRYAPGSPAGNCGVWRPGN